VTQGLQLAMWFLIPPFDDRNTNLGPQYPSLDGSWRTRDTAGSCRSTAELSGHSALRTSGETNYKTNITALHKQAPLDKASLQLKLLSLSQQLR